MKPLLAIYRGSQSKSLHLPLPLQTRPSITNCHATQPIRFEQTDATQSQKNTEQTESTSISVPPTDSSHVIHKITPFHTHSFFVALEKTFPSPVAGTLMRATKGLLVDRILRIRRDALDVKDLDNQAYLFRAALSELRTEATMQTRNQSAALVASTSALRREVDGLDGKMKEALNGLKHDIQMEMDNHRTESRSDMKRNEIRFEDGIHRSTIALGNIRTEMEQAKWDNSRRGVAIFGSFVLLTIILMEFRPFKKSATYPPKGVTAATDAIDIRSLESTET